MAITLAQWRADPNHIIRVLVAATVPRPMKTSEWTSNGDNTWRTTWPPSDHSAIHTPRPSAVKEWNGTTLVTLAAASSQANCNATDASQYYDRANRKLYINPTGGALATKYWTYYPLRLSTHDFPGDSGVAVTESTEAVQYYGVINQKPSFSRSIELLDGIASIGGGSLSIADDLNRFNFSDRFSREELFNSAITIRVGGGIPGKGEMAYADYVTMASGNVSNFSGDVEGGTFQIAYNDGASPYSAVVATGVDFYGTASDIVAAACAAASPVVTAPTEAAGLDTARPYWCALSRQESTRVIDIIGSCIQHLMMFYVTRGGSPTLDWWKVPDSGETLGGIFRQDEADGIKRSIIEPYTTIDAAGGQGIAGTRATSSGPNGRQRSSSRDDNFEVKSTTLSGGWTNHPNASNTWYRGWTTGEIDEVDINGVILIRQGSVNGCDTDNLSWVQAHNDGATSGNPNRIYINPQSSPNAGGVGVNVKYKVEKQRTAVTVTNGADTNFKTSTSAELKLVRSKNRVMQMQTLITNATHLQDFAAAALALTKWPLEVMDFATPLTEALSVELNQTIRWDAVSGGVVTGSTYWRVIGLADDLQSNRCNVRCWRASLASAIT